MLQKYLAQTMLNVNFHSSWKVRLHSSTAEKKKMTPDVGFWAGQTGVTKGAFFVYTRFPFQDCKQVNISKFIKVSIYLTNTNFRFPDLSIPNNWIE